MGRAFVHLHTHSHYSLLDGVAAPEELVQQAAALGMPALALTDHDALFGAARFYRAARAAGIRPIIGCELTLAPAGYHVTVLARDAAGYGNLCRLATLAATAAAGGRPGSGAPGVDRETLWRWGDGLVVLSGCGRGEIPSLLAAGHRELAGQAARAYRERFGPDGFFIELQDHGLAHQAALNRALADLAADLDLPVVATHNVHYVVPDQAAARTALARLAGGKPGTADAGTFHLASAEEMVHRFADFPAAVDNTLRIADLCQVSLDPGGLRLPAFAPGDGSPETVLRQLAAQGARQRYEDPLPRAVRERLEHELAIIGRLGLASYFLILWDAVSWARRQGILIGPGRGSATSSLVVYCLGITDVDPLAHGLVFERFLNPDRQAPPDIDIDVCDARRGDLLDYMRRRHGAERVAQIAAFATLAARAALREMGRALGVPAEAVDRLVRLVPQEPGMTLAAAEEVVPALAQARQEPQLAELWRLARAVEGAPSHLSVHAAGIVVGDGPLDEQLPLVYTGENTRLIQYPMDDVEALGYLKMDFLGLRTLTVIQRCREIIRERGGTVPEPLPSDDPAVYEMLIRDGTDGVFQLETPMFRRLTAQLQPAAFKDLVALLALGRPGPSQRIDAFLRRRHGRKPVRYMHPALEPLLEETYGIILYQEQVMRIAMDLAGFSPAEADLLRRGMSKKQPELLSRARARFLAGARERRVPEPVARAVFEELERFAGYGFAKSHSVAYARISYETAYLRCHYPAPFMAALLSSVRGNPARIARYVDACRRLGVQVLPPDVNESDSDFTVDETGRIRYGLSAVKHVGHGAAAAIVAARGDHPFRSLQDLVQRVPGRHLTRRVLEALINAGACDGLGPGRRELLLELGRLAAPSGLVYSASGGSAAHGVQASIFGAAELGDRPRPAEDLKARSAEPEPSDKDASDAIGGHWPVSGMLGMDGPALVVEVSAAAAPKLQRLARLLRRFPGKVPVVVRVRHDGGVVTLLAEEVRVAPSDRLLVALKNVGLEGWITAPGRRP